VIVECKATRVPENARYLIRDDLGYAEELCRGDLVKAVEQINATWEDIRSGIIATPWRLDLQLVGSVIVYFQELPQAAFGESVLSPILPSSIEAGGVRILAPQPIMFTALADLQCLSGVTLLDILRLKQGTGPDRWLPLGDYLRLRRPGSLDLAAFRAVDEELLADVGSRVLVRN
jgi:hypothetical protein